MNKKKTSPYTFMVASLAAFAGILFGYDTGVISGAILFIDQDFQLSAQANGFVVSSVLLGALCGALFSGRLADDWGRRTLLLIDSIIFIVGTILCSVAPNVFWLLVGRVIVGVAIGIASYTAPVYISELSPAHLRGFLVSLNQLAVTIGMLSSHLVDYALADQRAWRWMLALGVVPAVFLLVGMIFLPESPRWLLG